jgi:cardiolipin synthase
MIRLEGPLVTALDVLFATDWYSETEERLGADAPVALAPRAGDVSGQVIPSGPGFVTENNLRAFTTLIYSAQRRISLTSPYFVPDESLLYAVTTAAQRGVDVELFVSELGDQFMVFHAQRSYYEALLRAGVRIYLYPAPWILHAKHFSIDDDVVVIGSSNMDMRSFALNYEVSVMLYGADVVAQVKEVEDSYRAKSKELLLEDWLARGRRSSYVDNVMRLTAALQ